MLVMKKVLLSYVCKCHSMLNIIAHINSYTYVVIANFMSLLQVAPQRKKSML